MQQLVQDDLPPGADLRDLGELRLRDLDRSERIFALAHPHLPSEFTIGPGSESQARHFPVSLSPFLGRATEIATVLDLMRAPEVRLVTLTGPGGTGKTRLAQEVGLRLAGEFEDGAVFVDLAPLRDPALVLPEIAAAFAVRETAGRSLNEILGTYLAERSVLIVLDNFEQLLEAAADVSTLLTAGTRVKALVTSRAALRLRGEREYPVPALTFPDRQTATDVAALATNEAVAFFVDRARAVRPDFALTEENAPAVTEICARLDGLPLAIELAAVRIKVLPPATLAQRLERRLPLLTAGTRDAPQRQRTLRDAIAWSHDLLSPRECRVFRRLGVFVGGWTLEAAEAVANPDGDLDIVDSLAALADESLIRLDDSGAEPRYSMLETIREFAVEKLEESSELVRISEAHVHYLQSLVGEFERTVMTAELGRWQQRLAPEMANLRAAFTWLAERAEAEQLLRLAANAWFAFWERGSVQEARDILERALALPGHASAAARGAALIRAGLSAWNQGDNEAAERHTQAGLDLSRAERLDFETGFGLYVLNLIRQEQGDYGSALSIGEEAIVHLRRSGNQQWLALALNDVGLAASLAGDAVRARALRQEAMTLARAVGNDWTIAVALSDMGAESENQGEVATALEQYRESLTLLLGIDDEMYLAHPLAGIASCAGAAGQAELAARLLGAAAILHESRGTTVWRHERERDQRTAALARDVLGDAAYGHAFADGRKLTVAEATRLALAAAGGL